MTNLPLQPIEWREYGNINGTSVDAITPICEYDIYLSNNEPSYIVAYYNRHTEAPTKEATGFATIEEAKAWAWNHYNEKMQPYVKPMPTWIDASEQLPSVDTDTQFICAYDSAIDTFSKVVWFNADIGEFNYQHDDVLAWMLIPEFSTMQNMHKGERCE